MTRHPRVVERRAGRLHRGAHGRGLHVLEAVGVQMRADGGQEALVVGARDEAHLDDGAGAGRDGVHRPLGIARG